jgi:hypothetical protein
MVLHPCVLIREVDRKLLIVVSSGTILEEELSGISGISGSILEEELRGISGISTFIAS